ncbi:MAG: hypothetical protein JWO94_2405 [Verrucomicrobiaceae bacterium]|nr:hypothetical protein [Verrucomicrobiaceae bacterium]
MKDFPDTAFTPLPGYLEQFLFQNDAIDLPLSLFHRISFDFVPFELEGEEISTDLCLDFITLPVTSWKQLAGRTFDFPVNPEEGYIDGSILLFDAHNQVDVTRLVLGEWREDGHLPATVFLSVDFRIEGDEEYGAIELQLNTVLELTPLKAWMREADGNDPARLSQAIAPLVTLSDYHPP